MSFIAGFRFNSQLFEADGYLYRKNKTQRSKLDGEITVYYICYEKLCPAKISIKNEIVTSSKIDHNHDRNPRKLLKMECINEIKAEMRSGPTETCRKVFDRVLLKEK